MWLCKGLDVTSNSEIQHSSPPWCQRQESVHLIEAESGKWSSDGTAGVMAGIMPPEAREPQDGGPVRRGRLE